MLEKTYNPAGIEPRIGALWEKEGAFAAGRPERAGAPPFCIVIPPPNVTGSLHMGHALNNTLQDILCRFERMRGKDVLWQPGTDHAGIATQMVVERQLMERQEPDRRTLGREEFVRRVWAWKAESGGAIVNQLKRLGASCDWSRERFTLDEGLSRAVTRVFVDLYRKGLIYRDKRLVNWDPKFQTAISDLEVISVETKGRMWHFRYPIKGARGKRKHIVVATTRPETMLGDTAVAVHPKDKRYKSLIGKTVVLPLAGREIPVIADGYADPEQGSGAVKITPAHDFNDFEVGKRHGLPMINIFDAHARLNENAPEAYRGLDRFAAREKIVADLDALGLVEKIEPHVLKVPYGDRSNEVIEPWLTDQWYVDAEKLAKAAIEAVEDGCTAFVPRNWEKTYFEWMRNIRPWCISRQLWWGHRIPAWYGVPVEWGPRGGNDDLSFNPAGSAAPEKTVCFVAATEDEARQAAQEYYGRQVSIVGNAHEWIEHFDRTGQPSIWRDEDVLDTWFSSALWPFSTLGWPEKTPELARYYPTSVLVTGFDIIFFWVARMMMMGLHFMGEVPFRHVYIHALVRDEKGQKMSKSKGNVMDPLGLIDQYGADALRFTLAAMAAQGRDIKLSTARVEGYRNFATKLWNATRFARMNGCLHNPAFDPARVSEPLNRWIVGETERAAAAVTAALEAYKFNEAAGAIYDFVWGIFCDWYLEFVKPVLTGEDEAAKAETQAAVAWTLDQILKFLHPFMPFVTEELWAVTGERSALLTLSPWPALSGLACGATREEIGWTVELISAVRSVRTEMNVPAAAKIRLVALAPSENVRERLARHGERIKRLARLEEIAAAAAAPKDSALIVAGGTTFALPLEGVIDIGAERKRLAREIEAAKAETGKITAKLENPHFVEKAPEEVVEENRERKAALEALTGRLEAALRKLSAD